MTEDGSQGRRGIKVGFRVAGITLEWGPPVAMDQEPTASTCLPEANLEIPFRSFNQVHWFLSLFLSLSLSFSFSFSLSFHHSLTLVMQLATRSSRQEIARSGEIKCGRELSAAPSSARNQNFLCTHHSGLDLFFFLWDHVLNLGSNQGNLYEFKNSLIHFIVSSI